MFLAEIYIRELKEYFSVEKDEKQFQGTIHFLTKLGANSFPSNIAETTFILPKYSENS